MIVFFRLKIEDGTSHLQEIGTSISSLGRKDGTRCTRYQWACQFKTYQWAIPTVPTAIPTAGQDRSNRGSKTSQGCQGSLAQVQVQNAFAPSVIVILQPNMNDMDRPRVVLHVGICWPNMFILVGGSLGIALRSRDRVCNTAGYDVERIISRLAPSR